MGGCALIGLVVLVPLGLVLFFINPMVGAGAIGLAIALAVVGFFGARNAVEEPEDGEVPPDDGPPIVR